MSNHTDVNLSSFYRTDWDGYGTASLSANIPSLGDPSPLRLNPSSRICNTSG